MKFLPVVIILLSASLSFSLSSSKELALRLSRCLGREELRLHVNQDDFYYKLNQVLINRLTGLKGVTLRNDIFNRACSPNVSYPSIRVFNALIQNFENAFTYIPATSDLHSRGQVNKIVFELPEILKTLAIQINKGRDPKCVNNYFPELSRLDEYLLYLLENMSFKDIMKKNKKVILVLKKLENPRYLDKVCPLL